MSEVYAITSGSRAQGWRDAFGTDRLPIVSRRPEWTRIPGEPEEVLVYMLDVEQLSPEQRERCTRYLAAQFELSLQEAALHIEEDGIPLKAEGITLETVNPGHWR